MGFKSFMEGPLLFLASDLKSFWSHILHRVAWVKHLGGKNFQEIYIWTQRSFKASENLSSLCIGENLSLTNSFED